MILVRNSETDLVKGNNTLLKRKGPIQHGYLLREEGL
jgi:hypothetical protein